MSKLWWQKGIIYEVYPRSFQDSDGDGVGDLRGIAQRLDYLGWLGVDAIWLGPIYPSPMADLGYDVTDHTGIDPLFGTLDDFDRLLAEAHARGIRVLLDLVPNHTSDRHPWFLEARASRQSPRRDWYIWHDPAPDGGPPNNWLSGFGGSGWEWDEATRQYYYHAFLKEQPDLNWRNPEVRKAILDVMRFWLDRAVDGFRVDVLWHLIKDPLLRDNPVNPDYDPEHDPPHEALAAAFSADQTEVHEVVCVPMHRLTDEYDERVLIGEVYRPIGRLVTYYGMGSPAMDLPFNFQLIDRPWSAREVGAAVAAYEGALPPAAWPSWVLGNHDQHRLASRLGVAQARVAAMLLLTLRGTPTLYYGDEIGMHDVDLAPERVRDPQSRLGARWGRDPARTPMQWDASAHAGFTTGEPWLPVADDCRTTNVEAERADAGSMLSLYRRLIQLRRAEPALHAGAFVPVIATEESALAYIREGDGRRFLIVLNLGPDPTRFQPARWPIRGLIVLSTHLDRAREEARGGVQLRADEGLVIALA